MIYTCRCGTSYTKPFERACAICLPGLERKWGANYARVMPSGMWSEHQRPVWDLKAEVQDIDVIDPDAIFAPETAGMGIKYRPCMSYKVDNPALSAYTLDEHQRWEE